MILVAAHTCDIYADGKQYRVHLQGPDEEEYIVPSIEDALYIKRLWEEGEKSKTYEYLKQQIRSN